MRYDTTTAAYHAAVRMTDRTGKPAHVLISEHEPDRFEVMGEATLFALLHGGVLSQQEFVDRHVETIMPRLRRNWNDDQ